MENEVLIKTGDLIELGFPKVIAESYLDGQRWDKNHKPLKIIRDFYNALYTLARLYEKYTSKKLELKKHKHTDIYEEHTSKRFKLKNHKHTVLLNNTYTLYLNSMGVFVCRVSYRHHKIYKSQELGEIKKIVAELLTTKFNNDFEALKKEFAKTYAEEKAKIKLNEIEIYNWNAKFPTGYQQEEYENEKQEFIEALGSDKEFAEKQIIYIRSAEFFGESYITKKSKLKLKDILYRTTVSIRIYQNLLVFQTTKKIYAVELNETEKHKIFEILTLLKI